MFWLIFASVIFATIPSTIAAKKGYSPLGYYAFGLVLLVPALIVTLLLPARPTSTQAMIDRQRGHGDP